MRTILLAFLLLLILTKSAWAQGCPAGIPSAGNPACIPPDRENSPYYQSGYGSAQPSIPQSHWQLTWGAIAADETGSIGVAVGKFSKREAGLEAMTRCAEGGAKNCKLALAYHHQCAVIAKPIENGQLIAGTVILRGGPTIEDATQGALASCVSARGGGQCKIIYSACTKPVLVQ
jgi:hypothetical protein